MPYGAYGGPRRSNRMHLENPNSQVEKPTIQISSDSKKNLIFFTLGCPNSVALKYKSNLEGRQHPENHKRSCQELIGIIWNHRFPCRVDSNLITGSLCHFAPALPPAKHPHASSPLRPPTNFSLNRVHIP